MLETELVTYCSPTLANLKTANLFCYRYQDSRVFLKSLSRLRQMLRKKGVEIRLLSQGDARALIYVFRPQRLKQDFQNDRVRRCLREFGYDAGRIERAVSQLSRKIRSNDTFPHEIGLFLGFPPGDVEGFIQNGGQNAKLNGCWKVYEDEQAAKQVFQKYKRCTDVYWRCYQRGTELLKLCVQDRGRSQAFAS